MHLLWILSTCWQSARCACACRKSKELTRSFNHVAHAAPTHLHNTWSSFAALQANRPSGADQHGFPMRVNFDDPCTLIYNILQSPGVQCSALPTGEPAMFANRSPGQTGRAITAYASQQIKLQSKGSRVVMLPAVVHPLVLCDAWPPVQAYFSPLRHARCTVPGCCRV